MRRDCFCWLQRFVRVALVCWLLLAALALGQSESQLLHTDTIEACRDIDQDALETSMHSFTQRIFYDQVRTGVNIPRLLLSEWQALELDRIIDEEVARARERLQQDTSGMERFWSAWSAADAEALGQRMAVYAFTSERFQHGLEALSVAVATAITQEFEDAATDTAAASVSCLQTYIGSAYGDAVARMFSAEIINQTLTMGLADISLNQLGSGVRTRTASGVGTIVAGYIARAVLQRVTAQVAQRITNNVVGRVLGSAGASAMGAASTVVPVVGWVVGLGLIVWDMVDSVQHGALPQISQALSDERTKQRIRDEVSSVIVEDLPDLAATIASNITDEVYREWQEFLLRYDIVVLLAQENSDFEALLADIDIQDLYRLVYFVEPMSAAQLETSLANGNLERVLELPDSAVAIIQAGYDLDVALAWLEVTRDDFERMLAVNLYTHLSPETLSRGQLRTLLRLEDASIGRLLALPHADLQALLEHVPSETLQRSSYDLPSETLSLLAWYAPRLERSSVQELYNQWRQHPQHIERFSAHSTRQAIVASDNSVQAIRYVSAPRTPWAFVNDIGGLALGQVPWATVNLKYADMQYMFYAVMVIMAAAVLSVLLPVLRFAWRGVVLLFWPVRWLVASPSSQQLARRRERESDEDKL